jgi:hypothetical protein
LENNRISLTNAQNTQKAMHKGTRGGQEHV